MLAQRVHTHWGHWQGDWLLSGQKELLSFSRHVVNARRRWPPVACFSLSAPMAADDDQQTHTFILEI
ncbi:Uncharacterized protein APZ42_015580 [Daphnia magna]|uniref:Uncharacterized protein n=1 Tax=Daphnia magna TaxID=35525 RepID=A0A162NV32_9CRUS|nr:Uncharacterized protein APZ42_015580 [Daphnia magna]